MNDLLRQYTILIESTDTEKEQCVIRHKRYSNSGGHWTEETRIHYDHQINKTLKYLKNWYMDIEEIIFYDKDDNTPTAVYAAVTEVKQVSTSNKRNKK